MSAPIIILLGVVYFFPTLIAVLRGKANGVGGVAFVNAALGWTVAGWIVSFIWASSGTTNADKRDEERRHKELLAATMSNVVALPLRTEVSAAPTKREGGVDPVKLLMLALVIVATFVAIAIFNPSAYAQQTRTHCHQAGPTQVCETQQNGSTISTSRCTTGGGGTVNCESQSFGSSSSSSTTILPAPTPSLNVPKRP